MKFIKYIFLFFAFPLCVSAQENIPDSLIDEEAVDSSLITRRNVATNFNYLDHILEGRYLAQGDQFTKKWNDHLFIEAGLGLEQIVAPSNSYSLTPFTYAKFAVGKQFNPKHSLRLSLHGAYAYQKKQEYFMYQVGAKLDHIFDMSSYFAGYDPTRRLSVSTVVGVGGARSQYLLNNRKKDSGIAVEGHLGLQFKIFTGPQGYINIEPYAGISSDPIDISDKRNWRDYDAFYGANLTYVYYLRNNLSPEARAEYMVKRILKDELTSDSTLFSWRKPLFVEMANSAHLLNAPELPSMQTLGLGYTVSLGAWLSPAIALRGSVASENVVFTHTDVPMRFNDANNIHQTQGTTDSQAGNYLGLRAEALLNPLGFVRNYDWDSRFGLYVLGGLQVGKLWKRHYQENDISAYYQGYTGGFHFWARLSEGLQVFMEPRIEHFEYHKPRNGKPANWRYHDNLWSVNVGMTVSTRTRKYTDWKLWEERDQSQFMNKFVVGAGGGINYLQKRAQFVETGLKLGFNLYGFLEYHLNALHSVRLSADGVYHPLKYYSNKSDDPTPTRRYANAFISLDYQLNITNLLNAQDPDLRTFEAFAFVGPSIVSGIDREQITTPQPTVNLGAKLLYHVNRHLGIHITPTFYYVPKWIKSNFYDKQHLAAVTFIETLNAGVQYTF